MKLFFKKTDKQILEDKNEIFKEKGIPALLKNGFIKSPYKSSWYGKNNLGSYTYDHCRVVANSELQLITTHILKGDRWIQVYLNIFRLHPEVGKISDLNGSNCIQFMVPPNSISRMRLREDNYKLTPFFQIFFGKHHKIGPYFSKNDYEKQVRDLGNLIERDMANIDYFVKKWYEKHQPLITNWEGKKVN